MRRLLLVFALVVFAGCVSAPSRYGNFSTAPSVASTDMANDATKQLAVLFPPALTRLDLLGPTGDAFGTALVTGLRTKGYAVAEYAPPSDAEAAPPANGTPFAYALNQEGNTNTYFLTLFVGTQTLSRIYVTQTNGARPAGAWAHKE